MPKVRHILQKIIYTLAIALNLWYNYDCYFYYIEAYRSGHNEPHSKCGSPQGLVGSNPTASAIKRAAVWI